MTWKQRGGRVGITCTAWNPFVSENVLQQVEQSTMETQSCCTVVSLPQRNKTLQPNQATDPKNHKLKRGFGPWPISTWRHSRVFFPQSHPKLPIALPDPASTIWPSFPLLLHTLFIFTTPFGFFKLQWDIFTFQVLQEKSNPPARSGHLTGFKQDSILPL